MPRHLHPIGTESAEAAIDAFGNRARVAVLAYIREHDACTRGEIAAALEIAPPTTSNHLAALETAGLITSTPPRSLAKSGQWVRYSVVPERITELYKSLGRVLGQHVDR